MSSTWASETAASVFRRLRSRRRPTHGDPFVQRIEIDDRPAAGALPKLGEPDRLRFTGITMMLVGFVLVGFAVQFIGFSHITAVRDQQLALSSFRYDLANGTAPVGQTGGDGKLLAPGTPVAILDIPQIGIHDLVVGEGTTSMTTMAGPGHRVDTPLPGQVGSSVVFGRQAAYGASFANISKLQIGGQLTATTGQGVSTYRVTAIRYSGDPVAPVVSGGGRLTLVTAAGTAYLPSGVVRVDADLVSSPFQTPIPVIGAAALPDNEQALAGDSGVWPVLVLAILLLAAAAVVLTISRRLWGRWQTWIVAVPVLLALGIFTATRIGALLPNLM